MNLSLDGLSKEETILAVKSGSGHISQLQYDIPGYYPQLGKSVKIATMIRCIRRATSMDVAIEKDGKGAWEWWVSPKAKPDSICWPLYIFTGPSLEHVRGILLAETETKELLKITKRGKAAPRKSIDD